MELTQSEKNKEKVIVTVDSQDEAVDLLFNLPMWKWLRPRTLRIDLEIVGLRDPKYPRSMTFSREELAHVAGMTLLTFDDELGKQITEFLRPEIKEVETV